MEKIPLFGAYKKFCMTQIAQIKKAGRNGEWGWLFSFFVLVIIIFIVGLFALIGAVGSGLERAGIIKENIYAPKKELVYSEKNEHKGENGEYITTFKLKFSSPQGQTGGMNLFSYPAGCSDKNMELLGVSGTELKNGTIYAVSEYKITCQTKEPIEESSEGKLLFELKK